MRTLRQEIFSSISALALPLAVVSVFPYKAITFDASESSQAVRAFAAFVTLDEEEERRATAAVKAAWQADAGALRHIRAELSVGELPAEKPGPVMDVSVFSPKRTVREIAVDVPAFPPTLRASAPEKIDEQAPAPASGETFSRTELLKID